MRRGQAIVEFALVLPLLLLMVYAVMELGWLFNQQLGWQRGAGVLAEAAAVRMAMEPGESWRAGWAPLVLDERDRSGCGEPTVSFPDGDQDPGSRVNVAWPCAYKSLVNVIPPFEVVIDATAVIPFVAPPSASPAPSASVDP